MTAMPPTTAMPPSIQRLPTPSETALAEQFAAKAKTFAGADKLLRENAFAAFDKQGLPRKSRESWHYTDMRQTLRQVLPPSDSFSVTGFADAATIVDDLRAEVDATLLVTLDGYYQEALSSPVPAGVSVMALSEALQAPDFLDEMAAFATKAALSDDESFTNDPMLDLNTAFMDGGVVVRIAADTKLEKSLHCVHFSSGQPCAIYARSFIFCGAGSNALVLESFLPLQDGSFALQRNHALFIALEQGAKLELVSLVAEGKKANHLTTLLAVLGEKTEFDATALALRTGFFRRQQNLRFTGKHARAAFNGLSLLKSAQHGDNTLIIDHEAGACESREFFRHILRDEATGIYQGKVIVRKGAQKTDGNMKSQALLLSSGASMNNKPELEIYADDVVCGHGATCGALDEEQLFYLQSRGISRKAAEALLLEAFANAVLDKISHEGVQAKFTRRLNAWLVSGQG